MPQEAPIATEPTVADVEALHRRAPVADAHADSLMWNRDLSVRSPEGHVDFPRLREAGVKIQCFTIVTRGFPFVGGFPLFAAWRGWPREARKGPWSRCLWQLARLEAACAASQGATVLTTTGAQLEENLRAGRLSAILGVEGAHALEDRVERVAELHARGVRFMGLTHLSNNSLGGASFPGMGNRGLTPLGREVLDAMGASGMSVDVAHASPATLRDVLATPTVRPMCSHSGVCGAARSWRNLPDEALRTIADRGGVVGIIFAPVYLGGNTLEDVARHIEHALAVMGEEGVALGSDFDGMVPLPRGMRDVVDLPRLTAVLLRRGHPEARVERILGGNWRRFFRETLGRAP
ncbi:MAG: dipeptidase [Myxococcaceae bacterium]|nr:dipeptidase [Myxococcaceae bacterium]MCI0669538.1 dipeptidase [Myxococcaceae bacterium]